MADEPRAPLFTSAQIRGAFMASLVGMIALPILILALASTRPQGSFQAANDEQLRATLGAAAENLSGYELVGESGARIDIDHAIELVVERGVALELTELGSEPPAASAAAGDADGEGGEGGEGAPPSDVDGAAVFDANCAACHGAGGQGVPGAFPPLGQDNLPSLLAIEGGRDYLIRAVLYGVQGPIEVNGQSYDGVMPAWPQLSDGEIAAVLNHASTSWDNELPADQEPIAADEVAAARGEDLSPGEVHELRP